MRNGVKPVAGEGGKTRTAGYGLWLFVLVLAIVIGRLPLRRQNMDRHRLTRTDMDEMLFHQNAPAYGAAFSGATTRSA